MLGRERNDNALGFTPPRLRLKARERLVSYLRANRDNKQFRRQLQLTICVEAAEHTPANFVCQHLFETYHASNCNTPLLVFQATMTPCDVRPLYLNARMFHFVHHMTQKVICAFFR